VSFANNRSTQLTKPVIDVTALPERFDITLPIDVQESQSGSDTLLSSLLSSIQGAGLKLQAGKAPLRLLVIDQAQKIPLEN
jgi:uncharacterized protein (TIGR03435 family)